MNEDCLKLTAYFAERDRVGQRFLGEALLEICERHAFQASVMLRGAEGFGPNHILQTDRLLSLSEDLPAVLTAVDTRARIETALPEIIAIDNHGLVTLERASMLTGPVQSVALPEDLHDATKLTIYCGRHERAHGRPAYIAIVDLLRRCGALSATVLLGVDGTSHGNRERARFFARNQHVPLMIVAVAPGAQISEKLPEIATLLERPLITLERVRVCKADGERIDEPQQIPSTDPTGLGTWMMLTIHADQSTHHGSHALHSAIIHHLRPPMRPALSPASSSPPSAPDQARGRPAVSISRRSTPNPASATWPAGASADCHRARPASACGHPICEPLPSVRCGPPGLDTSRQTHRSYPSGVRPGLGPRRLNR